MFIKSNWFPIIDTEVIFAGVLWSETAPLYTCKYCRGKFKARLDKNRNWGGKFCDKACQRAYNSMMKDERSMDFLGDIEHDVVSNLE